MRPVVTKVLSKLLGNSQEGGQVTLDEIGETIGSLHVTHDEIDAIIHELERQRRVTVGPKGGGLEQHLKRVLSATRALKLELSRKPRLHEIALRADLSAEQVRHALSLARIMQR